jgi:RNA methyltransferase, TrmH family
MPFRIVQSKQNSRLKQLRRALIKPLREPLRGPASDGRLLAGIEGPNLLEEALRAGLYIDCVFVAQGSECLLEPLALAAGTEVLLVPPNLLTAALATEAPQAVAALVSPRAWAWDHIFESRSRTAPLVLVLAGLQDPGNLGTILRSAEAFGASGVVSLPGTVSEWNPKAVRASAGSVFRIPVLAAETEDAIPRLHEHEIAVWATLSQRATPVSQVNLAGPVALIIGNEGSGVPPALAARANGVLTIPCPGAVESLNAATAASILLYEAARQRAASPDFQRTARSTR